MHNHMPENADPTTRRGQPEDTYGVLEKRMRRGVEKKQVTVQAGATQQTTATFQSLDSFTYGGSATALLTLTYMYCYPNILSDVKSLLFLEMTQGLPCR